MPMIDGVTVKRLTVHADGRGRLFEVLRRDDPLFRGFGQAYVTMAKPGVVKGWHRHRHQTDHFSVVAGEGCFVLYDSRADSPTFGEINEVPVSGDRPQLIVIPPGVYHGFQNTGESDMVCLNCPDKTYDHDDPDEERLDPHDNKIPYEWDGPRSGVDG